MTTLIPCSSNLQDTITPLPNSLSSPTSTRQNIQLSPPISTSRSVNPPIFLNPSTLSLTRPEPAVALTSSSQNLRTALSTADNLLAFEDRYENELLQHPAVKTYSMY